MKHNRLYSIMAVALTVVALGAVVQPAQAQTSCDDFQLSGAIFTTDQFGEPVNMNIYNNKRHVYLDGGPGPNAPVGAAALPAGDYYFQVTDPSGKTLLSSDGIESRMLTVSDDGVIVSAGHSTNDDADYGGDPYYAVVVQLYPFDDTPNNGGVYKVWVTPVACYSPGAGKHGFVPSYSKTDNFKVKGKVDQYLCVRKFRDCNGNGAWDEGEPEIPNPEDPLEEGWPIIVVEPESAAIQKHKTPFCILAYNGCWLVSEEDRWNGCYGWLRTAVIIDGVPQDPADPIASVCFTGETTRNDPEIHEVIFGNQPFSSIKACKFYDLNGNKLNDDGLPVPGIKFLLRAGDKDGPIIDTQYTGADGCAHFCQLLGGVYTVEEVLPTICNWLPTTPRIVENIVVDDCQDPVEISHEFGNIIVGEADFDTKGYWHNKNGLGEITDDDISHVNGLAPYASPSSYFGDGDEPFDGFFSDGTTPVEAAYNNDKITDGIAAGEGTARAEISHFLTDANASGDPREQLAQQLLAFIFNVRHRVGSGAVIQLPDGTWRSTDSIIAEAIAKWTGGTAAEQTTIKDLLDTLNNDDTVPYIVLDFSQCVPSTPY